MRGIRVLFTIIAAGLALAACSRTKLTPLSDYDMTMGRADAPITLVEYASVTCPHCAEFNADVMPQLKAKYIDTGKVYYVYRESLTPPNEISVAGAMLARCAGKDHYFEVIDAIMKSQDEMFGDDTTKNALPVLRRIGGTVGMSEDQVNACINNPEAQTRVIDKDEAYTKNDGVNGTPTFFVNGHKLVRHTGTISDFDRAFVPFLNK